MQEIGEEYISEIIEPSCGDGAFYHHAIYEPHIGYDIDPQCNFQGVIKGDFLNQKINYLWGRLIIGNPPYGRCLNLAQKFFKKSIQIADYIAFILPIGQLNNNKSMYEFDLISSTDLGFECYSGRYLHCCFNVYKRPKSGEFNKKPITKLQDITIYRQDCRDYENKDFDVRMCYWGDGTAGKILSQDEHYSAEYKIKINNPLLQEEIINTLKTFNWKKYLNSIAMRKIQQFHIVDVLSHSVKGIK